MIKINMNKSEILLLIIIIIILILAMIIFSYLIKQENKISDLKAIILWLVVFFMECILVLYGMPYLKYLYDKLTGT